MLREMGINIELTVVQATVVAITMSIAIVISIGLLNLC